MTDKPNNMRNIVRDAGRREILKVVEDMVLEQGEAYVSMMDVARRVQCAVGTLYHYFPSRDAMFDALVESRLWTPLMHSTVARDEDTHREQLQAFLEYCAQWARTHAALIDALGIGNTISCGKTRHRQDLQRILCEPDTTLWRIVDAMVAEGPSDRRVDVYFAQIVAAAVVAALIRICASEHYDTRTAEHVCLATQAILAAAGHESLAPWRESRRARLGLCAVPSGYLAERLAGR